jgi:hypothetical protein
VRLEGLGQLEKSNDLIGIRTRDLPGCSIVSQPTTLPCAPSILADTNIFPCSEVLNLSCCLLLSLPTYPRRLVLCKYANFCALCLSLHVMRSKWSLQVSSLRGQNRRNRYTAGFKALYRADLCSRNHSDIFARYSRTSACLPDIVSQNINDFHYL